MENETMSFVGKWMGLKIIILILAKLKKSNIACFCSYVQFRPKMMIMMMVMMIHEC
jgi:hypothetical protein